ncbi:MAG: sigma 54-interacting transcriptional regulator [Myxococcota bacterium]|jgi:DNA-binding NtrC family response regulator|nr:sigma 54-interacting transcriptional regulator [Myxococcota bacterium]
MADTTRHETHPLRAEVERTTRGFRVRVIEGPDVGVETTLAGELGSIAVGTSEVCGLRLTDRSVSRRHLTLDLDGDRLALRDLGSRNGTRVSGLRVGEASIESHVVVTLGQTRLELVPVDVETAPLSSAEAFGPVLGRSRAMRRLYPLLERLAASELSVVLEGETGTGKELVAEALHAASPRGTGPFVVFDCSVVPAGIVEAELFGHVRGAFTGATDDRAGVFRDAHGGTLFLDEIADLPLAMQPKLLRALDRRQVRPLGASAFEAVDVRVVAATRRNLDREVQNGRFREDLFHRLAVGRVELPSLRRRHGDVTLLVEHFWKQLGGRDAPSPELIVRLEESALPGNVRELKNAVARAVALGALAEPGPRADPDDDVQWIHRLLDLPLREARQRLQDEFEHRYVRRQLERANGNVTHAAKASGVARRYFQVLKARSDEP